MAASELVNGADEKVEVAVVDADRGTVLAPHPREVAQTLSVLRRQERILRKAGKPAFAPQGRKKPERQAQKN